MTTPTYDLIDSEVLGASAASVTFSSLDTLAADYRDIVLVADMIGTGSATFIRGTINSDTGNNYPFVRMSGDGSTTSSAAVVTWGNLAVTSGPVEMSSTAKVLAKLEFLDFSVTDKHKTILTRTNSPTTGLSAVAQSWASTAAITSIEVFPVTDAFAAGSTFYLYGIAG